MYTHTYIYTRTKWCTSNCSSSVNQCSASLQATAVSPAKSPLLFKLFLHGAIWYGTPFDQFGSAVLVLSSPSSLCPQSPHWQGSARSWDTEISFALCSTAQQQLKHQCAINIVFLLKPKLSIIPDTMKKIDSVQLKPGHTAIKKCWYIYGNCHCLKCYWRKQKRNFGLRLAYVRCHGDNVPSKREGGRGW